MVHKVAINPDLCPGKCGIPLNGYGTGERWHEACYQAHVHDLKGERCTEHALCSQRAKRVKEELRRKLLARDQEGKS